MNNSKKQKESFTISEEVADTLQSKAAKLNIAKSQITEHALREYLGLSLDYSPRILIEQSARKK